MGLHAEWVDRGRYATQQPNPKYPDGIDIDMSSDAVMFCSRTLPYPAPRCGLWIVACDRCGLRVAITAAGRIDDPRSVKVACRSQA